MSYKPIDVNDVVAHVKTEYIIPPEPKVHKPQSADDVPADKDSTSEPPTKKQKLTGTIKNRPKLIKVPRSNKLCKSMWCLRVGEDPKNKCTNETCPFSHDIDAYLQAKPENQEGPCHNYRTYGMCHYGLICRFGKDHIDGKGNRVDDELWSKYENRQTVFNTLKKEVQFNLRKYKYDFSKSFEAVKVAQSEMDKNRPDNKKKEENGHVREGDKNENGLTKEKEEEGVESIKAKETIDKNENNSLQEKEALTKINKAEENGEKQEQKELNEDCKSIGPAADDDTIKLNSRERKKIDWRGKTYLAPLTTVGNLPFRRVCKDLGADITCSEMAVANNLLQGSPSEWALVKRHESEDLFGVQLCGNKAANMVKCAQLICEQTDLDFIDINMGCPIDLIYKQGGGSALMRRDRCLEHMVLGMQKVMSVPLTLKMRTAIYRDTQVAHNFIQKAKLWDVSMVTLHGRSKEQRYLKIADWNYINDCATKADPMPLFGNGDVMTYEDYYHNLEHTKVSGIMIGRGALIKPWIFKEIKEKKHWDITSSERFDILKKYTNYGMEHWGSDSEGIEKTRRFLLEWLSFMHRYIPVGILEETQKINQRPPLFKGRDELETLLASRSVNDWIKISEMLLGPTPSDFNFLPKHKANAY